MDKQIRTKREEIGWTREELARRIGVAVEEIERWEEGTSAPSPLDIARIFATLHDGLVERLRQSALAPRPEARP